MFSIAAAQHEGHLLIFGQQTPEDADISIFLPRI